MVTPRSEGGQAVCFWWVAICAGITLLLWEVREQIARNSK